MNNSNNNLLKILEGGDMAALTFNHCTLVPGRLEGTMFEAKVLFSWQNIPSNTKDTDNLKSFLRTHFGIFKWLEDEANLVIEAEDDKKIKILITNNCFISKT